MYRCELCNVVVPPGTRANRVVLETRPAEYPSRPKAHKRRVGRKLKFFDDPGGAGFEIAREAVVCRVCYERFEAERKAEQEAEAEAMVDTALGEAYEAAVSPESPAPLEEPASEPGA